MRYLYLIITTILLSCGGSTEKTPHQRWEEQRKREKATEYIPVDFDKIRKLKNKMGPAIPEGIAFSSKYTKNIAVNEELFGGEMTKDNIWFADSLSGFYELSGSDNISFSRLSEYQIRGLPYYSGTFINFDGAVKCKNCSYVNMVMLRMGYNNRKYFETLNDRGFTLKDSIFSGIRNFTFKKSGLHYINLITKNDDEDIIVTEVAAVITDLSPPVFRESESCHFTGTNDYYGLVCITTKEFEGNQHSGYDVPLKGQVHGDIRTIKINGQNVAFQPNKPFFARVKMKLAMGYNQVPIVVTDKANNKTDGILEITIESINDSPDIYIDNDIDIDFDN